MQKYFSIIPFLLGIGLSILVYVVDNNVDLEHAQTKKEFVENYRLTEYNRRVDGAEKLHRLVPFVLDHCLSTDKSNWKECTSEVVEQLCVRFAVRVTDNDNNIILWLALNEATKSLSENSPKQRPSSEIKESMSLPGGPYMVDILRAEPASVEYYLENLEGGTDYKQGIHRFGKWIENNPHKKAHELSINWLVSLLLLFSALTSIIVYLYTKIVDVYTDCVENLQKNFKEIKNNNFYAVKKIHRINKNKITGIILRKILNQIDTIYSNFNNCVVPFCEHLILAAEFGRKSATESIAIYNKSIVPILNDKTKRTIQDYNHDFKDNLKNSGLENDYQLLRKEIHRKTQKLYKRLNAWPESNQDIIQYLHKWFLARQNDSSSFAMKQEYDISTWPEHFFANGCWEFFDMIVEKIIQNARDANEIKLKGRGYGVCHIFVLLEKLNEKTTLCIDFIDEGGGINDNHVLAELYQTQIKTKKATGEGLGTFLAGGFCRIQGWDIEADNYTISKGKVGLRVRLTIPGKEIYNE